jgi:hypothetical protein
MKVALNTPVEAFRWRTSTKDGKRSLLPSEMETRHVFYTLLMIWNHTMPIEARTEGYKEYTFSSFYTPEYMAKAVYAHVEELATRRDMLPQWTVKLNHMTAWLAAHGGEVQQCLITR